MKIIEAMKKVKDLARKADDIREKIKKNCADLDCETAVYPDQRRQIDQWLQAHHDIVKEISTLRTGIQRTNMATQVTIEIGGKGVTKSIAEWIHRRRDMASMEELAWRGLTDRNLKEGTITQSTGVLREVKIRRYYDPAQRDNMVEVYRSEPLAIDSALEVVNAITDMI